MFKGLYNNLRVRLEPRDSSSQGFAHRAPILRLAVPLRHFGQFSPLQIFFRDATADLHSRGG